MSDKTIFIVGFTGAGKTTYGNKLAQELKLPFIDLDELIEQKTGMSISEIFAAKGEAYFRLQESEILKSIAPEPTVIACGGGTPCFFDNMEWMNRNGETIYLKTTPETLFKHLQQTDYSQRPLLQNKSDEQIKEWIFTTLQKREPYYLLAQKIVEP